MTTFRALAAIALLPLMLGDGCSGPPGNVAYGVLARERVALSATASEIVTELPVAEGSAVWAGDVLVELDKSLQAAQVATAEAERSRAKADLDKVMIGARPEERAIAAARVQAAKAAFVEARSAIERSRVLLEHGTITQARFDQETARYDSARAELSAAEEAVAELDSGAREEDRRMAKAQLAAAEARLEGEKTKLANLTIRASRDGVLDSLPWNLGERVSQGSPVAVLLAGGAPFARVYVPEPYRARLAVGDPLTVRIDGIEAPIEGKLRWIGSEPAFTPYYALNQKERSNLVYLAEVELVGGPPNLPVGIPVQVSLP